MFPLDSFHPFASTRLLAAVVAISPTACAAPAAVRYTPMPEAPRSLYIALSSSQHVAFDTERLRIHTAWTGPGLELRGSPHTANKTPFTSEARGEVFFTSSVAFPWQLGEATEPNPNPGAGAQFEGWAETAGGITLRYRVGEGTTQTAIEERVHPLPGFERSFVRELAVKTGSVDAYFTPFAEFIGESIVNPLDDSALAIQRTNGWLLVVATTDGDTSGTSLLQATTGDAHLHYQVNQDNQGESQLVEVNRTGRFARVAHTFAARTTTRIAIAVVEIAEGNPDFASSVARIRTASRRVAKTTPARAAMTLQAPAAAKRSIGSDPYYAIESFALPPDADLKVTGMTWLSPTDLAVCTWTGDVWVLENATGPADQIRYRRFAHGLNEPLGLVVVNGELVVIQKPELTRLRDTNGDGAADAFDCLTDDWGFTGNYHAFAFGPVVDTDGSFLLAFCGQRARWDVKFASWLIRVSPDGTKVDPIAGGLRAPNGIDLFGPENDIFVADNQGNWIGACKLNHVRRGEFYGFPAATPAPRERWDKASPDYAPPAVWFPRKLAPSAAGFVTIPETGFGPFGGQLAVADFQNAVVVRVALEKVNGQWQGAVFPFLKGFGSGANRVVFDAAGRLYVGGLENKAWPSGGPFETSLDRVTFTGETPFDIKEVHARADGLELVFTQPADREFAADPDSYAVSQFNYEYHQAYGSAEFDHDGKAGSATSIRIKAASLSDDGRRVRLQLEGWKTGYVTRVLASGVESETGELLRADECYYTLNELPRE